jgi:hypothetical protein
MLLGKEIPNSRHTYGRLMIPSSSDKSAGFVGSEKAERNVDGIIVSLSIL